MGGKKSWPKYPKTKTKNFEPERKLDFLVSANFLRKGLDC